MRVFETNAIYGGRVCPLLYGGSYHLGLNYRATNTRVATGATGRDIGTFVGFFSGVGGAYVTVFVQINDVRSIGIEGSCRRINVGYNYRGHAWDVVVTGFGFDDEG